MSEQTTRERILRRMKERGYYLHQPDDPFTLSSGKTSPYYCDVKSALMDPDLIDDIGFLLRAHVSQYEPDHVVGVANAGYLMVAHACSFRADPRYNYNRWLGMVMRKKPKGHGLRRGFDGIPPTKVRARVVLVDDVITTGKSLAIAAWMLEREWNAAIVGVVCVVDRNEGDDLKFSMYRESLVSILKLEDFT